MYNEQKKDSNYAHNVPVRVYILHISMSPINSLAQ